jgi:hypothetical protein
MICLPFQLKKKNRRYTNYIVYYLLLEISAQKSDGEVKLSQLFKEFFIYNQTYQDEFN